MCIFKLRIEEADFETCGWGGGYMVVATKFSVKHQGKDIHHPPSTIYKWPLSDLPRSTICPSLSLRFTISRWRGHEDPNNYYTFIGGWWCIVLGDYQSRKSHDSWGPGVFNFNTLTFMLNFGRYVLVSKSSICSAIVHRESSWWRNFHFHSFGKFDLILNRQLMTVFRRVKRVRLKLVEGPSCKSWSLLGLSIPE